MADIHDNFGPTMKMYFHWGYKDYILFESWVPTTGWSYFWACVFCFFLGICYETTLAIHASFEEYWLNGLVLKSNLEDATFSPSLPINRKKSPTRRLDLANIDCGIELDMDAIRENNNTANDFRGHDSMNEMSPLLIATTTTIPSSCLRAIYWTPFKIRLMRSAFRVINVTGAYICMLLVMSFNIGLFSAIVLGLGVGSFVWGNVMARKGVEKEHCC